MQKSMQKWMAALLLACYVLLCGGQAMGQAVAVRPSLLSKWVVYLSAAGIAADGATDQAAKLQTLFNLNSGGGSLEVVNDLTGDLLTSGNTLNSTTTVRTLAGGRWKLKTNSQKPLFINAHPTRSTPSSPLAPVDHDIKILGGYFDGNSRGFAANGTGTTPYKNSAGFYISIIAMYGVKNLTMEGVETYDPPNYGIHYANVINGRFIGIRGSVPDPTVGGGNDTIHANGPVSQIVIRDVYSRTNDDAVPFNLLDNHVDNSGTPLSPDPFGGFVGYGDGTDILVDGVVLDGNSQGLRVLVGVGVRGDRITFRNITGTCSSFPVVFDRAQTFTTGSIGSVTVENLNVRAVAQDSRLIAAGYPPCSIYVQCPLDILTVHNLTRNNPADARSGILLRETIGGNAAGSISVLNVDGVTSLGSLSGQGPANLVEIRNGANVGQFVGTNFNWLSSLSSPGNVLYVAAGGSLGPYVLSNSLLPGNTNITAGSGTISASAKTSDVLTLVGVVVTNLFSDTYTRANAATLGGDYTIPAGNSVNPSLVSNQAKFAGNVNNNFAQVTPAGSAIVLPTTGSTTITYTGSRGSRIIAWSNSSYQGYIFQYEDTGIITCIKQAAGGNTAILNNPATTYTGNQTLKMVRNGNNFTFYVGGVQVGTYADSSPINNTGLYLYAGSTNPTDIVYTSLSVTTP